MSLPAPASLRRTISLASVSGKPRASYLRRKVERKEERKKGRKEERNKVRKEERKKGRKEGRNARSYGTLGATERSGTYLASPLASLRLLDTQLVSLRLQLTFLDTPLVSLRLGSRKERNARSYGAEGRKEGRKEGKRDTSTLKRSP